MTSDRTDAIRRHFQRFTPLAVRGLARMVAPDSPWFCHAAYRDDAGLRLEGISERYTAMSLIGLARHESRNGPSGIDMDTPADALHGFAPRAEELGDAGLVLWSEVVRDDLRAEATAAAILDRRDEMAQDKSDLASMETGFLLIGVSEAIRAGIGGTELRSFAADVAERLRGNQHEESGLFSFKRKHRRKNVHRARTDSRLGSFASQVYPTMGFAAYARATGIEFAQEIATRTADRLCELQGPQGQWWWVYHHHRPAPAVRYPVYTVHQDAMGPMALLAAALADGGTDRYDPAVDKSFTWFDERPECAEDPLIDDDRAVVWRAVQLDDPRGTGRLGLSDGELARMGRAAWFGTVDKRDVRDGFVCPECRPYHLGWILLAAAMFEECVAARVTSSR